MPEVPTNGTPGLRIIVKKVEGAFEPEADEGDSGLLFILPKKSLAGRIAFSMSQAQGNSTIPH